MVVFLPHPEYIKGTPTAVQESGRVQPQAEPGSSGVKTELEGTKNEISATNPSLASGDIDE
jgi:hypothetical protein